MCIWVWVDIKVVNMLVALLTFFKSVSKNYRIKWADYWRVLVSSRYLIKFSTIWIDIPLSFWFCTIDKGISLDTYAIPLQVDNMKPFYLK
jgi:hypothetical protein